MTELETALLELSAALDEIRLPHILIGGLAVSLSGEPRTTIDVDVSVWAAPEQLESSIDLLCRRFRSLRPSPKEFVAKYHVLPLAMSNGIRADVVFASIPLEREMIARGVPKQVGDRIIRVASVEDLLFMKLISTRSKDLADAQALFHRFRTTLDRDYLIPKLDEAAQALDRPEILSLFRNKD